MEELKLFGRGLFGIDGTPEMMPEIVKEAARRFPFEWSSSVKLTIVIEKSWDTGKTFEVDGKHLEELIKVANAVGARFKITEVQKNTKNMFSLPILRVVASHIAQQEEQLSKLELNDFMLFRSHAEVFFSIQQLSKEWRIQLLVDHIFSDNHSEKFWLASKCLARISTNGSIGVFQIYIDKRLHHPGAKLDDLKKVWRISEKFRFVFRSNGTSIEIGGGRGAETEAEWHRMLELVFEV